MLERQLRCHEVTGAWTEDAVTWNTQPATDTDHGTQSSTDDPQEWDVLAPVQAAFPDGRVAFRIKDTTEGSADGPEQAYSAREGTGTQPRLVIETRFVRHADLHSTVVADSLPGERWSGVRAKVAATREQDDVWLGVGGLTYDADRDVMWFSRHQDGAGTNLLHHADSQGDTTATYELVDEPDAAIGPIAYLSDVGELILIETDYSKGYRVSIDDVKNELHTEQSTAFTFQKRDIDGDLSTYWEGGEPDHDTETDQTIVERDTSFSSIGQRYFAIDDPHHAAALAVLEDPADQLILVREHRLIPGLDGHRDVWNKDTGKHVESMRAPEEDVRSAAVWGRTRAGELWTVHPQASDETISRFWIRVPGEIQSNVTVGRLIGTSDLDIQVQPANVPAQGNLESHLTPRVTTATDLDSQLQPANITGQADVDSQVKPGVGDDVDLDGHVQPANIPATSDLDTTLMVRALGDGDLDTHLTARVAGTGDLSATVEPRFSVDLDSQVTIGALADLDASATVQRADQADLEAQVRPGKVPADSELTATVQPSVTDVATGARAEGSVAPTVQVGAADFAEISAEIGSQITHTQDGASTSLRRVVQLVDTQTAKTFPREATSEHGRSSTQDKLGRGDAILYAKEGDAFQPGDTVTYDGLEWEVVGLLGWETVGDERIYQEVGLRRLSIVAQGQARGTVEIAANADVLSEVTVNVP